MADGDIKALEERIKALEDKRGNQQIAILEQQIKALKAELALRSESAEKAFNTRIDSTEKVFNTKNDSADRRITTHVIFFKIIMGFLAVAIPGITYLVTDSVIERWAKNRVAEIAKIHVVDITKIEVQNAIKDINLNAMADVMLKFAIESEIHGDSKSSTGIPSKFEEWYQKGESALKNGDYSNAITFFTKVLNMTSDSTYSAYSHHGIGIAYLYLNRYDEAFNEFNDAIDFKEDYAHAHQNRGIIFFIYKKYNEAIEDFNLAAKFFINENDYGKASQGIISMKTVLALLKNVDITNDKMMSIKAKAEQFVGEREKQLEDAKK